LLISTCGNRFSESYNIENKNSVIISRVPFIKQEYQYCGPAALTSVFMYYGDHINQDEVARHVYTDSLNGSLITDMKYYAVQLGYDVEIENGDADLLRSYIDKNVPVILLVDRGLSVVTIQHYYVVYGYVPGDNLFIIHDGEKAKRVIRQDDLDKEWKKMNRLMLVIQK